MPPVEETPLAHGAGAARAQADDREVGKARVVAELPRDQLSDRVELLGGDGAVLGAAFARQVLGLSRHHQGVQSGTVTEVHVAHEPDVHERLQVAVHRGDVRRGHAAAYSLRNLLGGHLHKSGAVEVLPKILVVFRTVGRHRGGTKRSRGHGGEYETLHGRSQSS